MDWEPNPAPEAPSTPETLREAGLSPAFVADQLLRTIYVRGPQLGRDLSQTLCLPFKTVRDPLRFLKDEKCVQVDGGDLVGEVSYKFSLTDFGRKRAEACMKQCAYIGPAPGAVGRLCRAVLPPDGFGAAMLPGIVEGSV